MNEKDLLLKLLSKQYGISEDEAAELLYQKSESDDDQVTLKHDVLKGLLSKDAERVASLKESVDKTEIFDQAYAKAKKEELEKAEKRIAKKYGVEIDKLDKLIDNVLQAKLEEAAAETGLTEDKIKTHPVYLSLENAKNEEISSLTEAHKSKIQELESGYAKKQTWELTRGKVLTYFDELKPVLSKDGAKAANQRAVFADMFNHFDFQAQEGSDPLVMKDGKRLEDDHGNPVSLKSLVEKTANQYYDFARQDPKGSAGNQGGAGGSGGLKVPTTEEEYNQAIFNANTPEERIAIADAYEASKSV